MSLVRISEFSNRPANKTIGDWFAVEGHDSSIKLERDEFGPDAVNTTAGHLLTTWTGLRIARWGSGPRGPLVYLLKYPVPLDHWYEFDAWFQYEHMPMLLEEPTWYGCEFFRALGASSYSYAALHYVEPQALKSDARNRSIDTPWWHRLKQHEWFDKQFIRTLMRPL